MRWRTEADTGTAEGVSERAFEVDVDARTVPGILWLPTGAGPGPRPLVLVGHGATLHKRTDYVLALAHLLVRRHGFAVAATDAPGHGDRAGTGHADEIRLFGVFLGEWSRPGSTDDMLAEWQATIADVRTLDEVGDGPLGYWGLSMGTIYGIPFVASEPRVKAAVIGLMGMLGPTRERIEEDSRRLSCPVLFLQQWHDQLIPRDSASELFDAVGSVDKRLHAHPGEHAAVPAEELLWSADFLARHLTPGTAPPRS